MSDNDAPVWAMPDAQPGDDAQRFEWLCAHMREGFCIVELIDGPHGPISDYRYVYANDVCTRHAGLRKIIGRTLRESLPAEADAWIRHYASVLHTGEPKHIEQRLEATGRDLRVSIYRLEPASARRMGVLFHECRDDWQPPSGLRPRDGQLDQAVAERSWYAQLVDSSLANVVVVDSNMRLQAINRTARHTFHMLNLPVPALGKSLRDHPVTYPEAHAQLLALWERALAGEVFIENVLVRIPPAERHFEMRFNLLRDTQGHILGAYLFAYDITQRMIEQQRLRDTEDALRHAQKMEAVGQLTGGIAHDFNNLLGGISAALELADTRLGQARTTDVKQLIETAQDNAARAAHLVQRLLAFARHQTLAPRPVDVHALVQDMKPLISTSLGGHIHLLDLTRPGHWRACVDPSQLENALLNLCINARDAMPGGGSLTLACANLSLTSAQAQALDLPAGDYLQLQVEDNGAGMSPQTSARALDPFFTTKPLGQGTGLGLSMAYGFVRQSGGQLSIQSSPEHGTLVEIYLPRDQAPAALEPPEQQLPAQANNPLRWVVLVEDQQALRQIISEVLREQGYQVSTFDTGAAALHALRAGLAPDLLITDFSPAGGLDGAELIDEAMALYPGLRALFITGYDSSRALGDIPVSAATARLGRPFAIDDLILKVRELLEG
ncbi:MAG: PAS domain-containing protein [Pseudomonas farsensis]|uniref:PAS domain-containing protein n=1 Tax=Pseudomonas farsensis TaxID=2745492 RepID=UPI003C7B2B55